MGKIQTYRGGVATLELPLQNAVFTRALQGVHTLVFSLRSPSVLDLRIGDTLTYKGEVMTVNRDPKVSKASSWEFSTEVTFQGHRHTLERFLLKDEGAISFDYFGTLDEYMYMFLESVNGDEPGWTLGGIDPSDPVGLTFDKVDCFSALNMIAQAFGMEWQIRGKVITVKKTVGLATTIKLAYGKDNGLYNLSRESVENGAIVNRAYGHGGSNNLPQGYSGKALRLPAPLEDSASIALYGVREGAYSNETIFPQRTSTATAVGKINDNTYQLEDFAIDFDLNGQRIDGTEARIVFKSGALNGQEFKILSYNHQQKRIRYEANKNSNGALSPSGLRIAEFGDTYTLIGIRMPSTYVDAAIAELSEKTLEYLNSNKVPRVVYSLSVDILDAKRKGVYPNEGDFIHVTDTDLAIDDDLRVTSVSYPALFPDVLVPGMQFSCEVGNDVTYTFLQKIEKDIKENKQIISQVSRESWDNDRRNALAVEEFKGMVFDPDGKLEEALVKGLVAFFGTPSQLFNLDPVPSFTLGADTFAISATTLVHNAYEIAGLGYTWDIPAYTRNDLAADKAYYLSARCSKIALEGEWVLTEEKRETDYEPNYWHFNLGILSSVIDGERSFQATKGSTLISGGQIDTDMITAYMINVRRLFAQLITVGSDGFVNAGISGLSDMGNESQRFWAGATEDSRYDAPFQILNDGSLIASKGKIGEFNLIGNSFIADAMDNNIAGLRSISENQSELFSIGRAFSAASSFNNVMCYLKDTGLARSRATGLMIEVANHPTENTALNIVAGEIKVNEKFGVSGTFEYERANKVYELEFEKGILVGQRLVQ